MALSILLLLWLTTGCNFAFEDPARVIEEQGYMIREHSLGRPFQGRGTEVPYWEFGGSTVLTNEYIRLTPDRQSKRGGLWNTVPIMTHNWEVIVEFAVHGSGKNLFGDGFAIWYTKEKSTIGPVLGNQDYFNGLGIFFDTYSNHNGEHAHDHPYISGMVNNGSVHYDHDRDGTHSQMAGCHAKFRNSDYITLIAVSYIDRRLSLMYNFDESVTWQPCFFASEVDLPVGYFLGFTAATGDLADNHDILSVKFYDIANDVSPETPHSEKDWADIMPSAKTQEKPRPHSEDQVPLIRPFWYRLFSMGFMIVLVVGVVAVLGGIAWKRQQERNKKRFF